MRTKHRNLMYLCIGIVLLSAALATYYTTKATSSKPLITVFLDAGHGGDDPGKIGINGEFEKDINLSLCRELAASLTANGYHVILSRQADCMLSRDDATNRKRSDLQTRVQMIEQAKADFAISIHQNSYPDSSVHGAQCFYYAGSKEGQSLAAQIQSMLIRLVDPENHRRAKANSSYYIIKNSTCPVVIVECGFLSNPDEALLLSDSQYQKQVALAITAGINAYVQSTMHNK